MEVLLVIEVTNLRDKDTFHNYLKKEGFERVKNEDFVYTGVSTTTTYATKTYILEVVSTALKKCEDFDECKLIFQLNNLPFQAYKFNKQENFFEEVKK